MSLTATSTPSTFELVPPGQYAARCYRVIDLGTQTSNWNGKTKELPKVLFSFEALGDAPLMKDGRPFSISARFTVSTSEKSNMRPFLESWRGQPFTDEEVRSFRTSKVLGKYCYINVVHEKSKDGTKTYANIKSIMPLPRAVPHPDPVNEDLVFDLDDRDMRIFEVLGKGIQATIMASKEWDGTKDHDEMQPAGPDVGDGDDIPF